MEIDTSDASEARFDKRLCESDGRLGTRSCAIGGAVSSNFGRTSNFFSCSILKYYCFAILNAQLWMQVQLLYI